MAGCLAPLTFRVPHHHVDLRTMQRTRPLPLGHVLLLILAVSQLASLASAVSEEECRNRHGENGASCMLRVAENCDCGMRRADFANPGDLCCTKNPDKATEQLPLLNKCTAAAFDGFNACDTLFCTYQWSAWSQCSGACGEWGKRKRQGTCVFGVALSSETQECYGGEPYRWVEVSSGGSCPEVPTCTASGFTSESICEGDCVPECDANEVCPPPECEAGMARSVATSCAVDFPQWSEWTSWGECSGCNSGDVGGRKRTRTCEGKCKEFPFICTPGDVDTEREDCPNGPKQAEWSTWSAWSACNSSCALDGVRRRTSTCEGTCDGACLVGDVRRDESPCDQGEVRYATLQPWSSWTACKECDGAAVRTRQRCSDGCASQECPHGAADTLSEKGRCTPYAFEAWSSWSACSTSCGEGERQRNRTCSGACSVGNDRVCWPGAAEVATEPCTAGAAAALTDWRPRPCSGSLVRPWVRLCEDNCHGSCEGSSLQEERPCAQATQRLWLGPIRTQPGAVLTAQLLNGGVSEALEAKVKAALGAVWSGGVDDVRAASAGAQRGRRRRRRRDAVDFYAEEDLVTLAGAADGSVWVQMEVVLLPDAVAVLQAAVTANASRLGVDVSIAADEGGAVVSRAEPSLSEPGSRSSSGSGGGGGSGASAGVLAGAVVAGVVAIIVVVLLVRRGRSRRNKLHHSSPAEHPGPDNGGWLIDNPAYGDPLSAQSGPATTGSQPPDTAAAAYSVPLSQKKELPQTGAAVYASLGSDGAASSAGAWRDSVVSASPNYSKLDRPTSEAPTYSALAPEGVASRGASRPVSSGLDVYNQLHAQRGGGAAPAMYAVPEQANGGGSRRTVAAPATYARAPSSSNSRV